MIKFLIIAWSCSCVLLANNKIERPPQFVLLAFDGSLNNDFWRESIDFADTLNDLKFTYFINPTYYLASENKRNYITPALNKSVSCIGWADSLAQIPLRLKLTNEAYLKGHDIGSHALSHCDQSGVDRDNPMYGHPWTYQNWVSEFEQFNHILFHAEEINKLPLVRALQFDEREVVGFRAPLLATTDGLWPALQKFHFKYDTSKVSDPHYWPVKSKWGIWNFPLAEIEVSGTKRKTLSMDFNWLYLHSGGVSEAGLSDKKRDSYTLQMYESYLNYFNNNYYGNRAPIHIGHHFSKWNRGAYWMAMKQFARKVCNLPEVMCVNYKTYAEWLDNKTENELQMYRTVQFDKLPRETSKSRNIEVANIPDISIDFSSGVKIKLSEVSKSKLIFKTNLEYQQISKTEYLVRANLLLEGKVVNWSTYRVINDKKIIGPLEEQALKPETSLAHSLPE